MTGLMAPGLASDPIPLQPDRSLAEYPTGSHFTGQEWGGLTLFAADGAVNAIETNFAGPGRMLDASQANQLYGIDGQLKFDAPVPETVAEDRYAAKREELVRNTEAGLDSQTFWGKAGRLGAGFVAGALDPINLAASFVPPVGEARMISALERAGVNAGTFGGRTAIRAATGAVRGVVGQAALEPLIYARARSLDDDFGPVDALNDLAFGAALGGGLHTILGATVGDHLSDSFVASPQGRLAAADLETREAALRTGVAALADDRPVSVDPVFDAASLRMPEVATLDPAAFRGDLEASLARIRDRGNAAADAVRWAVEQPPLPDTPEAVRSEAGMADAAPQAGAGVGEGNPREGETIIDLTRKPAARRTPKTLLQFVASKGGVRDEGGELKAMDLHQPKLGFQPGFGPVVRKRGMHPDNMRELAESAGFLKRTSEHETTTMTDLYQAMEAEIKSGRDYHQPVAQVHDAEYEAHLRHLDELAAQDAPELSEEGLLDEFTKLAAGAHTEDIVSHGQHEAFDIPWDDVSPGQPDAGPAPDGEAGGGALDAGHVRPQDGPPLEGAGREDPGAGGQAEGERRSLDAGGQTVLPGAERITDKELAERGMAGRKSNDVAQKPADEGLFDVAGRGQAELFAHDPEVKAADEEAAKADLLAKAWDAAAGCMGGH